MDTGHETVVGKNNLKNKRKRKNKKNRNKDKLVNKSKTVEGDNKENNEIKESKKRKPKLGENVGQMASDLTPEDMLTWAEFKLQEPIMRALMELGFKKPTKIQELSLPAAIHGK